MKPFKMWVITSGEVPLKFTISRTRSECIKDFCADYFENPNNLKKRGYACKKLICTEDEK